MPALIESPAAARSTATVRVTAVCVEIWTSSTSSPSSPPTITSSPEPVVIMSLPPSSGFVRPDAVDVGRVDVVAGARAAALGCDPVDRPLSPSTMLLPSPAPIVSPSMPPRTMSSPAPVVIESEPPISDSIVVDEAERERQRAEARRVGDRRRDLAVVAEDEVAAVARDDRVAVGEVALAPEPSSRCRRPRTSTTRSPSSPPMTTSSPLPVVIVSVPPVSGSIDADAVDVGGVAVDERPVDEAVVAEHDRAGVRRRASPRFVVIVSSSTPPRTTSCAGAGRDRVVAAERVSTLIARPTSRETPSVLSPGPPWPSTVVADASSGARSVASRRRRQHAPGRSRGRGRGRRR